MIRVELPAHLRTLAGVKSEVTLEVESPVTLRAVLDALEIAYPMLEGTIRDHTTKERRAFLRFFACEEDLSRQSPDTLLPEAVAAGKEPLLVIGAVAGGNPDEEDGSRLPARIPHPIAVRPRKDGAPGVGARRAYFAVMTSRMRGWSFGGLCVICRVSRSMASGSLRSSGSSLKRVTRG